jgi:hypothetical protein
VLARRWLATLGLCLGCPSDGSSATSDEGTSASPDDDDSGDDDDEEAGSEEDETADPATSTTDPLPTSTSGTAEGCQSAADCADGQYCDFPDDSCGVSGVEGICTAVRTDCGGDDRPVCGCDDALHDTICAASTAGQDVAFLGECEVPSGAFRCGFSFCDSGDEYCLEQAGTMPTHACIALPPVCMPPDCSCITSCCGCDNATCCGEFCSNDDGNLTYVCP